MLYNKILKCLHHKLYLCEVNVHKNSIISYMELNKIYILLTKYMRKRIVVLYGSKVYLSYGYL